MPLDSICSNRTKVEKGKVLLPPLSHGISLSGRMTPSGSCRPFLCFWIWSNELWLHGFPFLCLLRALHPPYSVTSQTAKPASCLTPSGGSAPSLLPCNQVPRNPVFNIQDFAMITWTHEMGTGARSTGRRLRGWAAGFPRPRSQCRVPYAGKNSNMFPEGDELSVPFIYILKIRT